MSDLLSPYALLKKCRPAQPAVFVTAYDAYSTAQGREPPSLQAPPPASPSSPPPISSFTKTHYIADINARHNRAFRSARIVTQSAVDYSSSSESSSIQSPQE